jgi:predicted esterase
VVPVEQTERLADRLCRAGADVTVHGDPEGHAVTKSEVDAAKRWIAHGLATPNRK